MKKLYPYLNKDGSKDRRYYPNHVRKKCQHDWMHIGSIWIKENIYSKVYQCRKCFRFKKEEPYWIKGRKRIPMIK